MQPATIPAEQLLQTLSCTVIFESQVAATDPPYPAVEQPVNELPWTDTAEPNSAPAAPAACRGER